MDRLVKPDVSELNLFFTGGQKCSATFKLTNLMHTMSVAVSLSTTNSSLFSFPHPFSIIPPLSTSSFSLHLSQPADHPPLSTPLDTMLIRSSMLPTGKAHQEDLRRLFSRPGPHIFKDAVVPISFVGPHVVQFLLCPSPKTLEIAFVLSKAVAFCDKSQLDSLLVSAAGRGNSYIVSALIDAGADVNSRDSDGNPVMSLAVCSGNIDVVQTLIESGYAVDDSVDRFLHDAAKMGRVDLMEILHLGYPDIDLNSFDSEGRTPVHIAAINGHLESLRFLLSLGADSEIADNNGWTPLHFAAGEGHGEAVEFLLNQTVYSKYSITKEGKTAFAIAAENGHSQLLNTLQLGDVLQRAARVDDVHALRSCISQGADLNGRDQNGWTPLHRACFKGRMESLKLLLTHGAQVDAVDDNGYTPLHLAIGAGHMQVALYLVAHGARANLKGINDFVAPFDLGCFKNKHQSVNHLYQEVKRT